MKDFMIRHIRRKVVIWIVCLLLFSLFGYLIFNSYNIYKVTSDKYKAGTIDEVGRNVDYLFLDINDFPQQEGNDILYIGRINSLYDLLNDRSVKFNENKEELAKDFMNFMEVNPAYSQLRYINEDGMEIVKVENDGTNLDIAEDKYMQNKKDRDYFDRAMILGKDEIYISKLDLNIENGVLENRGTEEDPKYVPVIRYAMPVFNNDEERKGFLIFNIYADYFLEDIRRTNKNGDNVFLVDSKGYYLAHSNISKEFSFAFGKEERIDIDYPIIGAEILKSFDKKFIEANGKIFTFRYLYPTIGTFEIYQGSRKIFGENAEEEHYWVLVSISSSDEFMKDIENLKNNFLLSSIFSALMILLVIVLLFLILAINGEIKR